MESWHYEDVNQREKGRTLQGTGCLSSGLQLLGLVKKVRNCNKDPACLTVFEHWVEKSSTLYFI